MLPQERMGIPSAGNSGQPPDQLYNNLNTMGDSPTDIPPEAQTQAENPFDKLTKQVEPLVLTLQNLNQMYSGGDAEFRNLMASFAEWLAAKSGNLNQGGGQTSQQPQQPAY